jgi:hypothetical protein
MSVDGPMRSTAGASRGTVTGGSRSTGNPRLRGRKTPSGYIARCVSQFTENLLHSVG